MKEIESIINQLYFGHKRTKNFLNQFKEVPYQTEALYWRMPFGKGRAHMGWQFMHIAATYHKFAHYGNPNLELDNKFLNDFGHGSIPDEKKVFSIHEIESVYQKEFDKFVNVYRDFPEEKLNLQAHPSNERTHRECLYLMIWHEASHLGQCQITWNSFRAMKGLLD